MEERQRIAISGWSTLPLFLVLTGYSAYRMSEATAEGVGAAIVWTALTVLFFLCLFGHFTLNPNEAKVLQFFGSYIGTVRGAGLRWANPLYSKRSISLRLRNFESLRLKVNDADGSPIEIGAVVSWHVVNTAEALFQVENYDEFVHIQTEAALRALAMKYPYETEAKDRFSLHGSPEKIAEQLQVEIQERLSHAGVSVAEARLTHLAYAPEIAAAMLQRQQAGAVVAARARIVEGAVGMVEAALQMLKQHEIVQFNEAQRANLVASLLVVLCSERSAQPTIPVQAPP